MLTPIMSLNRVDGRGNKLVLGYVALTLQDVRDDARLKVAVEKALGRPVVRFTATKATIAILAGKTTGGNPGVWVDDYADRKVAETVQRGERTQPQAPAQTHATGAPVVIVNRINPPARTAPVLVQRPASPVAQPGTRVAIPRGSVAKSALSAHKKGMVTRLQNEFGLAAAVAIGYLEQTKWDLPRAQGTIARIAASKVAR